MSKEETGNKEASGCCEGFGFGFKGFKDAMKACCGTEGEKPAKEDEPVVKDEPKKGCC
jgi:hypothetical protein